VSEAYPWNTSTHTAETGKLVTAVIHTRELARQQETINEAAGAKQEDSHIAHVRATELIFL
jgi:hypothetical protein